ncbi:MAG: U32 family peptidase [Bacteroidales bacterium]|nr:U32 family peptidase [Bacteroidales bacterium]
MDKRIEIMAPAGNFECLMAAIQGGADSVYFGVGNLNMRSHSANNFTNEDLPEVVRICREHGVKTYLTLNIVVYQTEMEDVRKALEATRDAGISAVIASDMAVIQMARSMGIEIHASTQMNISNFEAAKFYAQFADVIVLARELTLPQIKDISERIKKENVCGPSGRLLQLELFVHGALCMSISGKCYLSLQEYGASANRGSCYQLCRRGYRVTDLETGRELEIDNKYIMSPKDLCTIEFIDKIIDAGISVFKIEGRARSAEYVKIVTSAYRQAADACCSIPANQTLQSSESATENDGVMGCYTEEMKRQLKERLSGVFNRGFWDGYYQGARLGEWSEVYGNKAARKKVYVAKITNYFSKLGVAEVLVEAGEIKVGDDILIIGPSTGCIELKIAEIRVDLKPVEKAVKGDLCSIPVTDKLRRSDKLYLWQPA